MYQYDDDSGGLSPPPLAGSDDVSVVQLTKHSMKLPSIDEPADRKGD